MEPPWDGGTKVYINGPGHMIKMATMPIYGKTFKKLLLQIRKTFDLETLHVASETQVLQSYINDYPGLTLTFFMARPNKVTFTFEWGKLSQSNLMGENLQQRTKLSE